MTMETDLLKMGEAIKSHAAGKINDLQLIEALQCDAESYDVITWVVKETALTTIDQVIDSLHI